jgi:prepilin peptidase CpaA
MTVFSLYLLFAMVAVIIFDVTRYIIPNWLVGSLVLLYPIAVWLAPQPVDWPMALAAAGTVFAVGYVIFAMKWMGGGDIKLMTACGLWVGFSGLLDFLFLTALLGGVFALLLLIIRKLLPFAGLAAAKLPRILRPGEPVPYGVAIALAMVWLLLQGKLPALAVVAGQAVLAG